VRQYGGTLFHGGTRASFAAMTATAAQITRSQRGIFLFWAPLAAQWIMMALEGPFLAAIIARMGEPAFNLAAYGVSFALAILIESPVIMLMSASTALVEDDVSYRRLRNFSNALNGGSTALLLLVLIPPVYNVLMHTLLGLPDPVVELVYVSLWLLLPWPAAIGYRRFLHGILIRAGLTRRVAYGTLMRLGGMTAAASLLYVYADLPGAWVGAAALSVGVCTEAVAARVMAAGVVRGLLAGTLTLGERAAAATHAPLPHRSATAASGAMAAAASDEGAGAENVAGADAAEHAAAGVVERVHAAPPLTPGYAEIARFYYPLALTSFIALSVHPMLTFFMGRAPMPIESLAVFPVVHALSFLFRAAGFSFQEAVIALSGRRFEHVAPLTRFGVTMALVSSGGMAVVAFTPLAGFWFEVVSGLPPELSAFAITTARLAVLLPAAAVLLAFQQAVLVQARSTRPITYATALEVAAIAVLFIVLGRTGMIGANAAMIALVGGRLAGNAFLMVPVSRVLGAAGIGRR
jgi:progressive ankylosis protein